MMVLISLKSSKELKKRKNENIKLLSPDTTITDSLSVTMEKGPQNGKELLVSYQKPTTPSSLVGYIVLPPGHGKTYRHNPRMNLLEIDSLVHYKATPELVDYRKRAKETHCWGDYDKLRASLVCPLLPDEKCVVMVPSYLVGSVSGWQFLGGAALSKGQWEENMKNRSDDTKQWEYAWEAVISSGGEVIENNNDLDSWIEETRTNWVDYGLVSVKVAQTIRLWEDKNADL